MTTRGEGLQAALADFFATAEGTAILADWMAQGCVLDAMPARTDGGDLLSEFERGMIEGKREFVLGVAVWCGLSVWDLMAARDREARAAQVAEPPGEYAER